MALHIEFLTIVSKKLKLRNWGAYLALLLSCFGAQSLPAQTAQPTRLVVRDKLGLNGIVNLCNLLNCSMIRGLGDPQGQLFVVQTPLSLNQTTNSLLAFPSL